MFIPFIMSNQSFVVDLDRLHKKQIEVLEKAHKNEIEELQLQHTEEIKKLLVSTFLIHLLLYFKTL